MAGLSKLLGLSAGGRIMAPSFSAEKFGPQIPVAGQIAPVGLGPVRPARAGVAEQLAALAAMRQTVPLPDPGASAGGATVRSTGTPGPAPKAKAKASASSPASSDGTYPLGKRGKLIGTPGHGTHTIGNWQSDNAVDIAIPVGTPVYAVASGKLGNTGSLGKGGRFAGLRTNLFTAGGNGYYYAHLSKLAPGIKQGASVKKGQLLGYSGSANGVPHLHFGQKAGDPRKTTG